MLKNDIFKICAYFIVVICVGALVAPWAYHLGKGIVEDGWMAGTWLDYLHRELERAPFPRYFNRSLQITALILIYPALRWIGPGKGPEAFRLRRNPRRFQHLIVGFLLAGGLLLLMGWGMVQMGFYRPNDKAPALAKAIFQALSTGFAVALIEEILFRGALMALILRTARPLPALIFLSAFFAVVHFLKPPGDIEIPPVTWSTGFWAVGQIFSQFREPAFLAAEFATLFSVGWILGYARLKTASLWMPIGLHAGWVFGIKLYSPLTRRAMPLEDMLPWAGQDLKIGVVSLAVVALTGGIVWYYLQRQNPRAVFRDSGENRAATAA